MNQPGVKSVVGDVTMCEKEAQFDAKKYNEMAGKPQKEKAKKEPKKQEPKKEKKAEPKPAAEPEKPKEKPSDPWADCDKFTMDMDAWKRFYSNNDEDKSVEHFWTLVSTVVLFHLKIPQYLSRFTFYTFRLPQKSRPTTPCGRVPTNTLTNLPCLSWLQILSEVSFKEFIRTLSNYNHLGMFQRIEKLRKHAFSSVVVGGKTNDMNITGLWFWRGNSLAFERSPDWQIDYEVYNWEKLDWDAPETKAMVAKYWMWDEKAEFDGKAFNQAKIYK